MVEENKVAGPRLPEWPELEGSIKASRRIVASTVEMSPGAECANTACSWSRSRAPSTMAAAYEHVQSTGHMVIVDEITRTSIEAL